MKNKRYYACIITDQTQCCSAFIEFEPNTNLNYPEDFPEEGTEIIVSGIFDTYTENTRLYPTLRNAVTEFK